MYSDLFLLLSSDRQQLLKPPMSPCKSEIKTKSRIVR
nr:MAG TPA: hypothetical protein [Caudoviricetes sp.]